MVDKFYDTIIYNNRYKYILEGLKNTLIIADRGYIDEELELQPLLNHSMRRKV